MSGSVKGYFETRLGGVSPGLGAAGKALDNLMGRFGSRSASVSSEESAGTFPKGGNQQDLPQNSLQSQSISVAPEAAKVPEAPSMEKFHEKHGTPHAPYLESAGSHASFKSELSEKYRAFTHRRQTRAAIKMELERLPKDAQTGRIIGDDGIIQSTSQRAMAVLGKDAEVSKKALNAAFDYFKSDAEQTSRRSALHKGIKDNGRDIDRKEAFETLEGRLEDRRLASKDETLAFDKLGDAADKVENLQDKLSVWKQKAQRVDAFFSKVIKPVYYMTGLFAVHFITRLVFKRLCNRAAKRLDDANIQMFLLKKDAVTNYGFKTQEFEANQQKAQRGEKLKVHRFNEQKGLIETLEVTPAEKVAGQRRAKKKRPARRGVSQDQVPARHAEKSDHRTDQQRRADVVRQRLQARHRQRVEENTPSSAEQFLGGISRLFGRSEESSQVSPQVSKTDYRNNETHAQAEAAVLEQMKELFPEEYAAEIAKQAAKSGKGKGKARKN